LVEKSPDIVSLIADNGLVGSDIIRALTMKNREKDLSEMRSRLGRNLKESDWQSWFKKRPWLFGSVEIANIRDIDERTQADYITRGIDGFVSIVEIKTDYIKMFEYDRSHKTWYPSADLSKSIAQCSKYIHKMERRDNDNEYAGRLQGRVLKPKCILIAGTTSEWNEDDDEKGKRFDSLRILNDSLHGIEIMTYDQLLYRADAFLKNVETKP